MNETLYQIYNTFPTGLPIFAYVLYDHDILPKLLQEFPSIYPTTNGHKFEPRDLQSLSIVKEKRSGMVNFDGGASMNLSLLLILISKSIVISISFMFTLYWLWADGVSFDSDGHSWGIIFCSQVW